MLAGMAVDVGPVAYQPVEVVQSVPHRVCLVQPLLGLRKLGEPRVSVALSPDGKKVAIIHGGQLMLGALPDSP